MISADYNSTPSIDSFNAVGSNLHNLSVSPKLIEFYNNQKDEIEVVFVSSDKGEGGIFFWQTFDTSLH